MYEEIEKLARLRLSRAFDDSARELMDQERQIRADFGSRGLSGRVLIGALQRAHLDHFRRTRQAIAQVWADLIEEHQGAFDRPAFEFVMGKVGGKKGDGALRLAKQLDSDRPHQHEQSIRLAMDSAVVGVRRDLLERVEVSKLRLSKAEAGTPARPDDDSAAERGVRSMAGSRVFVSYARPDLESARRVHAELGANGLEPWMDKEDLLGGQDWESEIRRAIRDCDFILLLLSRASIERRGYYHKEIRLAVEEWEKTPPGQIRLIPTRLDDCEIVDAVARLHCEDLFPRFEHGMERVLRALGVEPTPRDSSAGHAHAAEELTAEQKREFRRVIIHSQGVDAPLCPRDGAPFDVIDATHMGSRGREYLIVCPDCGLKALLGSGG